MLVNSSDKNMLPLLLFPSKIIPFQAIVMKSFEKQIRLFNPIPAFPKRYSQRGRFCYYFVFALCEIQKSDSLVRMWNVCVCPLRVLCVFCNVVRV